jgi:hypothetical protein
VRAGQVPRLISNGGKRPAGANVSGPAARLIAVTRPVIVGAMTTDLLPLSPDQGRVVAPVEAIIAATRHQLAEARSLVELETVARKAAAVADLTRRARAADQVRIEAAELALDCDHAVSVALRRAPKSAGGRPSKTGSAANPVSAPTTLAELGISKARAAVYRDIGRLSDAGYRDLKTRQLAKVAAAGVAALHELSPRRFARLARDEARRRAGHAPEFSPIIKPSDSWNFSQPLAYPKLEDGTGDDPHGYIPGDLIANALFYFTRPDDVAVDPMAGSGMTRHVYQDRARWMGRAPWDLDVRLFDLSPRGPYRSLIERLDLTSDPLPVERADYILIDPPYYGISRGCYGDDPANLAELEWPAYRAAMAHVAAHCAAVQPKGGRLTLITPDYTDVKTGEMIAASYLLTRTFDDAGYEVMKSAWSTRRIQQKQGHDMAVKNNLARRTRIILTDISTVVTLRRG